MMSDGSRYDLLYVGVVGDGELVALDGEGVWGRRHLA